MLSRMVDRAAREFESLEDGFGILRLSVAASVSERVLVWDLPGHLTLDPFPRSRQRGRRC
jgi:hypothetical protein